MTQYSEVIWLVGLIYVWLSGRIYNTIPKLFEKCIYSNDDFVRVFVLVWKLFRNETALDEYLKYQTDDVHDENIFLVLCTGIIFKKVCTADLMAHLK